MKLAFTCDDMQSEDCTAKLFVKSGDYVEFGDCVAVEAAAWLCEKCNQNNASFIAKKYNGGVLSRLWDKKVNVIKSDENGRLCIVSRSSMFGIRFAGIILEGYETADDALQWAKRNDFFE